MVTGRTDGRSHFTLIPPPFKKKSGLRRQIKPPIFEILGQATQSLNYRTVQSQITSGFPGSEVPGSTGAERMVLVLK